MKVARVLSPLGMLGYGYPLSSLNAGLESKPDVIAVDAGSTDAGPHKLGAGTHIVSKYATKRDLRPLILGARDLKIPLLIGSAGGCGADITLEWTKSIVEEIIFEQDIHARIAYIHAEIDKRIVKEALESGRIQRFVSSPPIDGSIIDSTVRIVAQMGVEPFQRALEQGANIVIAGRSYDPCMGAAIPLMKGFPEGPTWHAAKIIECGAQCAIPGSPSDCILCHIYDNHFVIEPLNPTRRCTNLSVAAHTLYEKSHPYLLAGPGGILDLRYCHFDQLDEKRVAVYGSQFTPSDGYQVKLEGVSLIAYRTITIAGVRDPILVTNLDEVLDHVKQEVSTIFTNISRTSYQLLFHVYGLNGVMGHMEPQKTITSHELGIVLEVVADTQELANDICAAARSVMLHYHYSGRLSTGGNLAFPFSPSDIPYGAVYKFSIYHLMDIDDPTSLFPIELVEY